MAPSRPDKLLADWIESNTSESTAYYGGFPDNSDDVAVACIATGGPSPSRTFGGGGVYKPSVQVVLRGKRHDPDPVRDRANDLFHELDQTSPSTSLVVLTRGSGWEELQPDGDGRPLASFNVLVFLED